MQRSVIYSQAESVTLQSGRVSDFAKATQGLTNGVLCIPVQIDRPAGATVLARHSHWTATAKQQAEAYKATAKEIQEVNRRCCIDNSQKRLSFSSYM